MHDTGFKTTQNPQNAFVHMCTPYWSILSNLMFYFSVIKPGYGSKKPSHSGLTTSGDDELSQPTLSLNWLKSWCQAT